MENERTTWWFWIPALPKPLIVAAWAVFWALSAGAPFMRDLSAPGQPWWLDIWHGIGGNSIGVFTWAVIATQLTSEVVYMIFTFRANKREVEETAIKNRAEGRKEGRKEGLEEGIEIGREEVRTERDTVWQEWLDQVRDLLPEDAPPPPGLDLDNGAGNGHKEK